MFSVVFRLYKLRLLVVFPFDFPPKKCFFSKCFLVDLSKLSGGFQPCGPWRNWWSRGSLFAQKNMVCRFILWLLMGWLFLQKLGTFFWLCLVFFLFLHFFLGVNFKTPGKKFDCPGRRAQLDLDSAAAWPHWTWPGSCRVWKWDGDGKWERDAAFNHLVS